MIIKIPLMCRSKKNSQRILVNKRTGKLFISQSEIYKNFERKCGKFLIKYKNNITYPVNLKCTFYVSNHNRNYKSLKGSVNK